MSMLKKKILAIIRLNPKSVFDVCDPKGISILIQLRVDLSTLNYHKFKHYFRNTLNLLYPISNGIENTEHYFMLYQAYCTIRRDLLTFINNILNLYGFRNLSNEELLTIVLCGYDSNAYDYNATIQTMTIQFFNYSKRFEGMTTNNFSEYS